MEMPPYTYTPSPPNLTLSCTNAGLFLHPRTVPPDENTPIIRMNRKTGLVRKKEHCSIHFSSSSYALLPTPCGRDDALMLVYHRSARIQTYTMEPVSDILS
ncbi:hypothetical protein TNCV_2942491 [Trichonephila clavipes]|nr:hypothetical protein TNCV_2942491 [Trichonephila clavipes]